MFPFLLAAELFVISLDDEEFVEVEFAVIEFVLDPFPFSLLLETLVENVGVLLPELLLMVFVTTLELFVFPLPMVLVFAEFVPVLLALI